MLLQNDRPGYYRGASDICLEEDTEDDGLVVTRSATNVRAESFGLWLWERRRPVGLSVLCFFAFSVFTSKFFVDWVWPASVAKFSPLAPAKSFAACQTRSPLDAIRVIEDDRLTVAWEPPSEGSAGCREPVCGNYVPPSGGGRAAGLPHKASVLTVDGHVLAEFQDLPQSCRSILATDMASTPAIAHNCSSWCRLEMGYKPLLPIPFYCLTEGRGIEQDMTVPVFLACSKARTAMYFAWLPYGFSLMCAVAYGLPALVWFTFLAPALEREEVPQHEPAGPHEDTFDPMGPFACCEGQTCLRGDAQAVNLQMRWRSLSLFSEGLIDVACIVSYGLHGQPWYALLTFVSIAAVRDPFQFGVCRHLRDSFKRGFETEGLLEHQVREGFFEAPISAAIAVSSIILARPSTMSLGTVVLRLIAVLNPVIFVLPCAMQARFVLRAIDHGNLPEADFYEAFQTKIAVDRFRTWGPGTLVLVVGMSGALDLHVPDRNFGTFLEWTALIALIAPMAWTKGLVAHYATRWSFAQIPTALVIFCVALIQMLCALFGERFMGLDVSRLRRAVLLQVRGARDCFPGAFAWLLLAALAIGAFFAGVLLTAGQLHSGDKRTRPSMRIASQNSSGSADVEAMLGGVAMAVEQAVEPSRTSSMPLEDLPATAK